MDRRRRWPWIVVGILIAAAVTWALVATARLARAEYRERVERAERQRVEMESAGLVASVEADRTKLVSTVAGLEQQLKAVEATGARVRIVTRTVTGEATWTPPPDVICPEPGPGAVIAGADASPPPESPAAPGPSTIGVRARVESAIATTDLGQPFLAISVAAQPRIGSWVGEWQVLPEGEVEVRHDPALERALRDSLAPRRRLDLLIGASLDPDGTGYELGVAGGGKRFGWYALGEYAARESVVDYPYTVSRRDFRAHGGLRVSLR